MTITEAIVFFDNLLKSTDKKREIKVYRNFITILSNLKRRNLAAEDLQLIEDELKRLDLKSNPKNKRKYFNKKLNAF